MDFLEQHRKFKNHSGKVATICIKLAQLRKLGKTNAEIEEVIKSLNLPFGLHMYIMGHFSDLLGYYSR